MKTNPQSRPGPATKTTLAILAAVVLPHLAPPAIAQVPDSLKYSIPSPVATKQPYGQMGYSVAVEGSYTIAGAPYGRIDYPGIGVVKVFDSDTGALKFMLPRPGPIGPWYFGWSVAISGTRVVVGAPNSGQTNSPIYGGGGGAYVYDLASATPTTPIATFFNPVPSKPEFGSAVAISGTRVAVGAYKANKVYVYDLASATPGTPTITLQGSGNFGRTLGMSGSRLVVGGNYGQRAYVYDLAATTPATPRFTLNMFMQGETGLDAVAISGSRVIVMGAWNSVNVHDLSSSTPTVAAMTLGIPTPGFGEFGPSLAISGTRVVVGAMDASRTYVFDLANATPGTPVATLTHPNTVGGTYFGWAVAASETRVAVGAPRDSATAFYAGAVYGFDFADNPTPAPIEMHNDPGPQVQMQFGASMTAGGSRVAISLPGLSQTAVYDLAGPTPLTPRIFQGTMPAISGDRLVTSNLAFAQVDVYDLASATASVPILTLSKGYGLESGFSVFGAALGISGTRVVVGGYFDFELHVLLTYVYDTASTTPTIPIATLRQPIPNSYDQFGSSVAIAENWVVVGAPQERTSGMTAGRAYIYDLNSATPENPVLTLNNPAPGSYSLFGYAVAISDRKVVVTGTSSGGACVFDLQGATPTTPVLTLNSPAPGAHDQIGNPVSISGTRVVVGAHYPAVAAQNNPGKAYVFDLTAPNPTVPVAVLGKLNGPDDHFGQAVAITGTTIIIGAPDEDTVAPNGGAAYVYGAGNLGPFADWKQTQTGDANAPDADDADRDGVSNQLEYTLGLNPREPDRSALPQGTAFDYVDGRRLRILVPRDPAHSDVTVEVQAAGDAAGPWTTVAASVLGAPFTGPGYVSGDGATPGVKTVEVRDTVNVADADRRFMRVRVTH